MNSWLQDYTNIVA